MIFARTYVEIVLLKPDKIYILIEPVQTYLHFVPTWCSATYVYTVGLFSFYRCILLPMTASYFQLCFTHADVYDKTTWCDGQPYSCATLDAARVKMREMASLLKWDNIDEVAISIRHFRNGRACIGISNF